MWTKSGGSVTSGVTTMARWRTCMYSILADKSRVKGPLPAPLFKPPDLSREKVTTFLPNSYYVKAIKDNLVVLVSRILYSYIRGFKSQKRSVTDHIAHAPLQCRDEQRCCVWCVPHAGDQEGPLWLRSCRWPRTLLVKTTPTQCPRVMICSQQRDKRGIWQGETRATWTISRVLAYPNELPNGEI